MKTIGSNRYRRMVVGVAVVVAGVCAGMAQEEKLTGAFAENKGSVETSGQTMTPKTKPVDPFIKGSQPPKTEVSATVSSKETAGANEEMNSSEVAELNRCQVEIEVQFVAFDPTNVEKLVATGRLNLDTLTNLWLNGRGHLLAAPRVVTKAGQEGGVKNVVEYIYPTTFAVSSDDNVATPNASSTDTNTSATATLTKRMVRNPFVEPGGFETREVGAILSAVPEVKEDGSISLTLTPKIVGEPVFHDYGSKYFDANGKEQQARMEQPFFPVVTSETSVTLRDGQRILIGGGMPSADHKEVVYIFVSARIVRAR